MSRRRDREHQLLFLVYEVRKDHPTMNCRDMYYMINPPDMGRDAFERFCKDFGLSSQRAVDMRRTTDSSGVKRFENLASGKILTGIDQIWVSDITYYELNRKFYYLTFIMDGFSRRITGHHVSSRLFTEQTSLPALQMALAARQGKDLTGLVFHSDGGGQYYDAEFLQVTADRGFINSMCEYPWDNGKAERLNGVIKNNYLRHRTMDSFADLVREVDRSVYLYNHEKPHKSLKRVSPICFENSYIETGKTSEGEKSATEYENHCRGADYSPPVCGKTSSGSNIAQEYV